MLRALGRVGVRLGLALGLVVIVGGIVAVARIGSSPGGLNPFDGNEPQTTAIVDPTAGDDGEVLPTPSDESDTAIQRAAAAFAKAWLRRDLSAPAWHAGLAPLSTATLLANLEGVEPRTVPAARTVSDPRLVLRSELYAQVMIPVDTGSLLLNLLSTDGRWLVDAVDWERT
jgi:hypothetical protein